jgi:hypothetical protein
MTFFFFLLIGLSPGLLSFKGGNPIGGSGDVAISYFFPHPPMLPYGVPNVPEEVFTSTGSPPIG